MKSLPLRKLLIVDDEPEIVEIVAASVAEWGFESFKAANMSEGLAILAKEDVTAVLSDIAMPGGSGLEFLAAVRSSGNAVPFVFLTAYFEGGFLREALQLGAVDFLAKPFSRSELEAVVTKALEIGVRQVRADKAGDAIAAAREQKAINLLRLSNHSRLKQK